MQTLEKFEPYSDEYMKETQRENAYTIYLILAVIKDGFTISKNMDNALYEAMNIAEKEIGTSNFTVGLA